jgi:hypothetical protein
MPENKNTLYASTYHTKMKGGLILMEFPNRVKKERLLKAIEYIDVYGIPERRRSIKYYLLFNGTLYPPKYVLELANLYKNVEESKDINGKGIGMHRYLEELGFKILYPRDGIDREQYNRPIVSSNESLKTKDIKNSYVIEIGVENSNNVIFQLDSSDPEENHSNSTELIIQELKELEKIGFTEDDEGFPEGKLKLKQHLSRERVPKVIKLAKERFLHIHGKLFCEVCGFDFKEHYGDLGEGYIEGHHTIPISEMAEDAETKVEDIALVCANCHRMLHRKRPWLSITTLKGVLGWEH